MELRPPDPGTPFSGSVGVVDDDVSVRRALQRLLRSVGLESVAHGSGKAFLESKTLHEIDCLILDVHMPGMSGMEVLEEVRVAATKLPVVLTTGRYDVDFASQALATGASAFLRKPFSETELFDAIAEATGQPVEY